MPKKNRKRCGIHEYKWVWSERLQKPVKRVSRFRPCPRRAGKKAKVISKREGQKVIKDMIRKGKLKRKP